LFWDNTFANLNLTSKNTSGGAQISSELLTTGTGSSWVGTSYSTGYTSSSSATLTAQNLTVEIGSYYTVKINITAGAGQNATINFGGSTTGSIWMKSGDVFYLSGIATSTGTLTITGYNGLAITATVKKILNAGNANISLKDISNSVSTELRVYSSTLKNTSIGLNSGKYIFEGTNNTLFGTNAGELLSDGFSNTLVGAQVGSKISRGFRNTIIGHGSFPELTSGGNNISLGINNANTKTTSSNLIVIGNDSLTAGGVSQSNAIVIGNSSMINSSTTSLSSIVIGNNSGTGTTWGANFVSVGHDTLKSSGIDFSVAVGNLAGTNGGSQSVSVGYNSGYALGTSVALGHQAGSYNSNGTTYATGTTLGVYIGSNCRASSSVSNEIVIGASTVGLGTGTTIIGTTSTTQTHLYGTLTLGSTTTDATAQLVVNSTSKGFLQPRMTTTQRDAISATPATGLSIYNSSVGRVQVYNGTTWVDESKYALNRQTASYTLVLSDTGKLVETNVATANTVTVPLNSTQAFEVGARVDIIQYGAGQTTITPTAGVTIRSANGWTKINAQYGAVSLVKIGTDEWYLFGNLNA
jgi:hypothetical protein